MSASAPQDGSHVAPSSSPPVPDGGGSAAERWRSIIRRRAAQMDAAYAALGRTSHDFWDRRAAAFHRATKESAERDPIFRRLRRLVGRKSTVLDVGAGTGRFTLALAPRARQVIAVEPNAGMRAYLEQGIAELGLRNVTVLPTRWEDAPDDVKADIVLCAHVLYPVEDIVPFLHKLDAATRRRCLLYLRAFHADTLTSFLWERFHGAAREAPPTYVAAVDVLAEMGIFADVEVVAHPPSWRYDTLDQAVAEYLETLILPDTPATRAELRQLLATFLVPRDGVLTLPIAAIPSAIVSWGPKHRFRPSMA